mgnify:CR=1 FL=1
MKLSVVSGGVDPWQIGHLELFERSAAIADELFVIVNTDQFLTNKKGKPFMPIRERMMIVQALKPVDLTIKSIDEDQTVCASIKFVNEMYRKKFDKIMFCNGGDRSDTKKIRETDTCNKYDISLEFGIGGEQKVASSSKLLDDYTTQIVERPWGRYKQLHTGDGYVVKELEIDPGKELSDQFHFHRSEHWIVLSGIGHLIQGETRQMPERGFYIPEGESVYIRPAQTHKLSNPGQIPLRIVEVWAGKILEETDIKRLDVGPNYGEG